MRDEKAHYFSISPVNSLTSIHYLINSLPASILGLQQWKTRVALLDCEAGHTARASEWFIKAIESPQQSRNLPGILTEQWLQRLATASSPNNCQAAAIEILLSY